MSAPHETMSHGTRVSRRAEALGTENAFVVLAEVNALVRGGMLGAFGETDPDGVVGLDVGPVEAPADGLGEGWGSAGPST